MLNCFISQSSRSIPITSILPAQWPSWLKQQSQMAQQWIQAINFTVKPGNYLLLPGEEGQLQQVLLLRHDVLDFWSFGLPPLTIEEALVTTKNYSVDLA